MCWQPFGGQSWIKLFWRISIFSVRIPLQYVLLCESSQCVCVFMCVWIRVCMDLLFSCVYVQLALCVSAEAREPWHLYWGEKVALSLGQWLTGLRTSGNSPVPASHLPIWSLEFRCGYYNHLSCGICEYHKGSQLWSSGLLHKSFMGWAVPPASLPYFLR